MSLINRLLKELDQRRGRPGGRAKPVVARNMRATAADELSVWVKLARGGYLAFLMALITAAGVSLWYLEQQAEQGQQALLASAPAASDKIVRKPPTTPPKPKAVKPKPVKQAKKPALKRTVKTATQQKSPAKPATRATPKATRVASVQPKSPKQAASKISVAPSQADQTLQHKRTADDLYTKGLRQLERGQIAQAEQRFLQALDQYPPHADARAALGGVLMDSGRWQQAASVFNDGLSIDKQSVPFSMGLARALVEQGDIQQALDVLELRDDGNVRHGEFLALLAALYQRLDEHRDASDVYRRALAVQPYEGRWWMGLGISLEHREKWAQAQTAYENAARDRKLARQLKKFVTDRLTRVRERLPVRLADDR